MRVVVNSYVYTLIKIASLKNLNIKDEDYAVMRRIDDPQELLKSIENFFPKITKKVENLTLIDIEKALFSVYFKIYEKILASSPNQMQDFLKSLLYRYEIWNIKTYILGILANFSMDHIKSEMLLEPEVILNRKDFIDRLLNYSKLDEGMNYLKKSRYRDVIDRGYYYFQQKNEVFFPEALLDKYFFNQLLSSLDRYDGLEKEIFSNYVKKLVQQYNLTLVFRSVKNSIPTDLVKQLIIPTPTVFSQPVLLDFLKSNDIEEFYKKITEFLKSKKVFTAALPHMKVEDPISPIIHILRSNIIQGLENVTMDDIDAMTIEKIMNLVVNKETEIFKVLKLFVKIFHKIKS